MADYRVEDLLMIERWRMWSATAFIKSGGTLFPPLAQRALANLPVSRERAFFRVPDIPTSAADSATPDRTESTIIA